MKKDTSHLVDEHLESFKEMQEASTDEFFYTRLKAKMTARSGITKHGGFILKPVWAIATLVILLAANGFMLSQQAKTKSYPVNSASPVQQFAQSYDQSISDY